MDGEGERLHEFTPIEIAVIGSALKNNTGEQSESFSLSEWKQLVKAFISAGKAMPLTRHMKEENAPTPRNSRFFPRLARIPNIEARTIGAQSATNSQTYAVPRLSFML